MNQNNLFTFIHNKTKTKMKYFKLNQTVYHHEYGQGVVTKISNCEEYPITVEFSSCTLTFTNEGCRQTYKPITLFQNPIPKMVNIPLEGEYIRFTFEDEELLKGKWIKHKRDSSHILINYISDTTVGIDGNYYTYEELFNNFEFVDGKPCGKIKN
jgi:hypothetical protein